jgi:putative endonuclease
MVTVYVIQGAKKRYVGITNDLERRLEEHRTRSHAGALIGDFVLIHSELFPDYAAARLREKFLKSGQGREWLNAKYTRT